MRILIVESLQARAETWASHLQSAGASVVLAFDQTSAVAYLNAQIFDVMLLDLNLTSGAALAVADYAGFRQPSLRVLCLTDGTVFNDGSIFQHCVNASAFLGAETPLDDLAAVVEHLGRVA